MPLQTTTIGAYPKPDCVPVPDWFTGDKDGLDTGHPTKRYLAALAAMGDEAGQRFSQGMKEAIDDQIACGIDVPTDGEIKRENYVHYHCRNLTGFDFENLTEKEVRGGTYSAWLPTITSEIKPKRVGFLVEDWKIAQSFTSQPVKITLPGPLTVANTNVDAFYDDGPELGAALADALNAEVRALADAGCKWIQVDEPVLVRLPEKALGYAIDQLNRVFHGVSDDVHKCMHMCCGYPDKIDREDYPKAELDCYFQVADAVDATVIDAVSLEDAHRHNDLTLLDHFANTKIIFGAVTIAKSYVETVDEIRARLEAALGHIDHDRLIAAPDCGLGILGRDLAMQKLKNLSAAARSL